MSEGSSAGGRATFDRRPPPLSALVNRRLARRKESSSTSAGCAFSFTKSPDYVARLDAMGINVFLRRSAEISTAHDGRGLVFLCFEPVGAFRHRRMLVPELADEQGTLFPGRRLGPTHDPLALVRVQAGRSQLSGAGWSVFSPSS
jgi:hypothetical protein